MDTTFLTVLSVGIAILLVIAVYLLVRQAIADSKATIQEAVDSALEARNLGRKLK